MEDSLGLASSPATPPETLWVLALRGGPIQAAVAGNPASPTELLQWVAQWGDPQGRAAATHRLSALGVPPPHDPMAGPAGPPPPNIGNATASRPDVPPEGSHTRKTWPRVAAVLVIVGTLITAAATIVPMLADRGERAASEDTLAARQTATETTAPRAEDGPPLGILAPPELSEATWAVPLSAPIDTFPPAVLEAPDGQIFCSPEQSEWLDSHGTLLTGAEIPAAGINVRLANEATTGGALSLRNVRFESDGQTLDGWVHFGCPPGDRGPGTMGQALLLNPEGGAAVFGEGDPYWPFPEELEPPGVRVTINLSPGEIMHYRFGLVPGTSTNQVYSGRILADLAGDSDTTVTLVDGVMLGPGGPPQFRMAVDQSTGTLMCSEPDLASPSDPYSGPDAPCSPQEAAERFKAATAVVRAQ